MEAEKEVVDHVEEQIEEVRPRRAKKLVLRFVRAKSAC